jgi:hypothetical protein
VELRLVREVKKTASTPQKPFAAEVDATALSQLGLGFRTEVRHTACNLGWLELSGHKSTSYIWRYVLADDDEMERAFVDPWG